MDVTKGHIVLCFHSPFWPPDHLVFIPVTWSTPHSACSLSSLLGFSVSVSSLPGSQSLPVWIFCSPPLISHAGQPSAHSFFLCAHVFFAAGGPLCIVTSKVLDKAWDVCLFTLGILTLWDYSRPMSSYESYQVPRTQVSKCVMICREI